MGLDKDTLHVVIRLPFKRPKGFIEPPSIVWTDEMDHKLWQYISQKNTDWNYIAEQLGVPTSYLVRHAAFIYETQLRGIQQQLRLNGSRNTKSPVQTTSTSKPTSVRYSKTFQQEEPRRNRNESMVLSNLSNISPRLSEREITSSHDSIKQEIPLNNTIYKSFSSQHSREGELHEFDKDNTPEYNEKIKSILGTGVKHNELGERKKEEEEEEEEREEEKEEEEEEDVEEEEEEEEDDDNNSNDDDDDDDNESKQSLMDEEDSKDAEDSKGEDEDEDEEEEFSSHFERMKLQMEEPAFLPRKPDQSQRLSLSMQHLKKEHTPTQLSPAVQPVTPSSALNSVGSSFSDLSDSSITQSALEDAYMSKFNQGGSKMSIFNLSRKYN